MSCFQHWKVLLRCFPGTTFHVKIHGWFVTSANKARFSDANSKIDACDMRDWTETKTTRFLILSDSNVRGLDKMDGGQSEFHGTASKHPQITSLSFK